MRQQTERSCGALDTAQWTRGDTPHPRMNPWNTPVVHKHFVSDMVGIVRVFL